MNSPLWPYGICDTEAAGREKVRIGRNCDLELCLPGELYIMKLKKERYSMLYDMELIAHKLVRWENFIHSYRLPRWEEIPDFGLYMEQVVVFLSDALCFMPAPESPKERLISSAAINNYVRLRLMPAPVKKRYYRVHLAYLLMIGTSVGRKRECVRISRQHASGMKLCGERFSGNSAAAVFIEKELPMRWEAAPKALFCVITLPFS